MDLRWITAWVDGQGWLDPTANVLQPAVKKALDALGPARRDVKNFQDVSGLKSARLSVARLDPDRPFFLSEKNARSA